MRAEALTLVVAAAFCGACTDAVPCSSCPPIEGTYEMSYQLERSTCAEPSVLSPPEELTVERVGSTVRAPLLAGELVGTLYDSFDFTLAATLPTPDGGAESIQLAGRFVPPSSVTDGGTQLQGRYLSQSLPNEEGEAACNRQREFVGRKR